MARKATHYGECQVCGSRQKLPAGVLSKHGYTVAHGFFEGVCFGEGELPFEQSCELVKESIVRALRRADELDALAAEVDADVDRVYVHRYNPAQFLGRHRLPSGYSWHVYPVADVLQMHTTDDGFTFCQARDPGATRGGGRVELYTFCRSVDMARGYLNSKRSAELRANAAAARQYAEHQQQRVDAWAPRELRPIAA